MKVTKFILAFFPLFFIGCHTYVPEITHKDYKYEKTFFGNHNFTFEISLENISNSDKALQLIRKLIYQNRDFDEYADYTENRFVGAIRAEDYQSTTDENGTEYFYHSDLVESYKIVYCDNLFAIINYDTYFYYSGAAHGNNWTEYFIIDLAEERILGIDELVNQIPDNILMEFIKTKYGIDYFLRDNIWPPDSINFQRNKLILVWNTYTISAYSFGIITIELEDAVFEPYLTEKGKKLLLTQK